LRHRRLRRSRPLARSSHQRPRGCGLAANPKKKTWRISLAQGVGLIGRRKGNPSVQMDSRRMPGPDRATSQDDRLAWAETARMVKAHQRPHSGHAWRSERPAGIGALQRRQVRASPVCNAGR
jgi:hypothetical protein